MKGALVVTCVATLVEFSFPNRENSETPRGVVGSFPEELFFLLGIYVPQIFFWDGVVGGGNSDIFDVAEAWTMAMAIPSLQWVELIAAPTP